MRYARWASVVVSLGLVAACSPTNGQTPTARERAAGSTEAAQTADLQLAPSEQKMVGTLTIEDDPAGGCRKAGDPLGPIYTKKGRVVQWFIVNNCATPVSIEVRDFVTKGTNKPFQPFGNALRGCKAGPGPDCLCAPVISGTVLPNSPGGKGVWVFTYTIVGTADGKEFDVDPEIVIEWF